MKNIFVIGQCTLHWGRMEFGNIGNYYIIEPFFRELHRVFPQANIKTTFQMSDGFCEREHVQCVPMDYYYAWDETYLTVAEKELAIASSYYETHELKETTPYIDEVLRSDLIIDFSGDIWGRNADLVGPNRFLIGLMKDRVVQLLGKPIAMLAGSPGPFNADETLPFAKQVFEGFLLVTNREPISRSVLEAYGFNTSKVVDLACPAFMFEPASSKDIAPFIQGTPIENKEKPTIGFVLCGWNMIQGPFNREDWKDEEFVQYVELITHIVRDFDVNVCLMSHSNGFILPPNFKLIKGRDYPIVEQLYRILQKTEIADSVYLMDGLYDPKITKGIIANFDMLISGRVHAAVAGLSQNVPTVIIDYGHEPKAHKLQGFAQVAAVQQYVANPADKDNLIEVVDACWNNRKIVAQDLEKRNLVIKELIHKNFDLLRYIEDMSIEYRHNTSSQLDILQHLQNVSSVFVHDLSNRVDVKEYSQKLFSMAEREEAWSGDNLIGLVAYYINHDTQKAFITNVSVDIRFQKQGIATKLLENAKCVAIEERMKLISLEAANDDELIAFYLHNGFSLHKRVMDSNSELIMHLVPMVVIRCTVYNHEPYLRDCLEGFVMQQTNFPFVAIVHDDASTDNSAAIIREYEEKYPNIIKPIYEKENQWRKGTLTKVMNAAIDATGAKYVAMCEGDDYWTDPLKLKKQVDFLEANPEYSMCCNATRWLCNDGKYYENPNYYGIVNTDITTHQIIKIGGLGINLASVVYRNIDAIHEYRKSNWWSRADVGDYPLCIALSLMGKIRYMSDVMSIYRFQRPGSWTESNKKVNIKHLWNEITWLQIFDKETKGIYHESIQQHLFPTFWRNLYRNNKISTLKYVHEYFDSKRPLSVYHFFKDIVRHFMMLLGIKFKS